MNDLEIYNRLGELSEIPTNSLIINEDSERIRKINEHRLWLKSIRHERPNPAVSYRIGVYIRYFNQTKYDDYLSYHKKQFEDTIALCPKWTLVDFYIDKGSTPPKMKSSEEWCRLIRDCFENKIDLIITQKLSNITKDPKGNHNYISPSCSARTPYWDLYRFRRYFYARILLSERSKRYILFPGK